MFLEDTLMARCGSACELCGSDANLAVYEVPPANANGDAEKCLMICGTCNGQIEAPATMDATHWRCLNDAAWSELPAVQVMAYRLLKALEGETWASDLIEQMYLDEEVQAWADSDSISTVDTGTPTLDSNGTLLQDGDTVTLVKDLDVKGTTFIAKRGTIVKNIRLTSNPEHIEGVINKAKLVLKTCFMKKA